MVGDNICYTKDEQLTLIQIMTQCNVSQQSLTNCLKEHTTPATFPTWKILTSGIIGMVIGGVTVALVKK